MAVSWEPSIKRFERLDQAIPPPARAWVFCGSSTLRLWVTLAADMAPLTVINRGFGGAQLADIQHYASRIITPYQPLGVVLYAGDNDFALNPLLKPDAWLHQATVLAQWLRNRLPATTLAYVSIKPSPARLALWPTIQEVNSGLQQWAANCNGIFIDIAPSLMDTQSAAPNHEYFAKDGIHLNTLGYAAIAPVVKSALMARSGLN